ncbi:MAG: alpha/beta fold hydrolase [Desulfobacterales bacterium]|nr:alpha/beta fold hydrolase [Desulfobacterales bacterium]
MTPSRDLNSPWVVAEPNPCPRMRLFCFPYAGGGASVYRQWQQYLPQDIQVCAVQPPGRENRISESPYQNVFELVSATAVAIRPYLERPFAFFGHSTGALVAFELARKLRAAGLASPEILFVSGSRPPHIPEPNPIHHLPDPEFIEGLRRFSGTPEELLQNKELMEVYTPILRADLALEETYIHPQEFPLQIPMAALGGTSDQEAPKSILGGWKNHTTSHFSLKLFQGNHFYLRKKYPELLAHISLLISQTTTSDFASAKVTA